jgi:nucleotide-binding universal stress UspA family protein
VGFKLEHILVPVDFGASSRIALDRAVALAADYRADVTLFHAIPVPFLGFGAEDERHAREKASDSLHRLVRGPMRGLRRLHDWSGVALTCVVVGDPVDEIVDAVDRLDVSTIVLGLVPHSAIASALRPSVTDRVIRRARCPVVVIRAPSWARPEAAPELDPALDGGLAA